MKRWGLFAAQFRPMEEMLEFAREADQFGADSLWTADYGRDVFVTLAAIAQVTKRARIGTGIALCFARPPALVQLAASDIDELSGGRMLLGLGTGPAPWNENWYGVAKYRKPVTRMKEFAQTCRAMWRSDAQHPVSFDGRTIQVRDYGRVLKAYRDQIPIYLGGTSPETIAAVGEVADGWITGGVASTEFIAQARAGIDQAFERTGRKTNRVEIACHLFCFVDSDSGRARGWARRHLAAYAATTHYSWYQKIIVQHGFAQEVERIQAAFRRNDPNAAAAAVTDEMVDTFVVAGTEAECRKHVDRWASCADTLLFSFSPRVAGLSHAEVASADQAILKMARGL